MTSKTLLASAALIEAATGVVLIIYPALVVQLLLGGDISGPGLALGRVGGFGLLSLSLACWPRTEPILPALDGMLTYNALVTLYFAYLWLGRELVSKLLLPVVALHAVFTILLARARIKGTLHRH
jgi:hypothetical protein